MKVSALGMVDIREFLELEAMIGQDPQGPGFGDGLASVVNTELVVEIHDVAFHGFRGDKEGLRNLLIAHPLRQEAHNFELAIREVVDEGQRVQRCRKRA